MLHSYLSELPIEPAVLGLLAVCLLASVTDIRQRRIPNWLVLSGLVGSFVLQYLLGGWTGIRIALIGVAATFVITVGLMLLKVLGAGDSKLMLVVGASLGVEDAMLVLAIALVLSGVLALAGSVLTGRFGRFKDNLYFGLVSMLRFDWSAAKSVADQTAYRVPFAVPVLLGVGAWLMWIY